MRRGRAQGCWLFVVLFLYLFLIAYSNDEGDYPKPEERFCRLTFLNGSGCLSTYGLFRALSNRCFPPGPDLMTSGLNALRQVLEQDAQEEITQKKSSNLIYQIIIILLLISVTTSIVEYFKEKWKKPESQEEQGEGSGCTPVDGRRMSLADLTMSRHARKQSQAFRPQGGKSASLVRRSSFSSMQEPVTLMGKKKVMPRQTSCPQPLLRRLSSLDLFEEDTWAEKRRVRMIHRH